MRWYGMFQDVTHVRLARKSAPVLVHTMQVKVCMIVKLPFGVSPKVTYTLSRSWAEAEDRVRNQIVQIIVKNSYSQSKFHVCKLETEFPPSNISAF